ncbi:MAG: polysaccharide biosynthesis/export family protein [Bacteroidales bacterium]|nr:polysaccharide biosynthesis/export family protein [Bacteroidales bacterium]
MVYLQKKLEEVSDTTFYAKSTDYKVQSNDVLFVKIVSINEELNKFYNFTELDKYNIGYNKASLFLNGISVSDSGIINLPVVGNIFVKEKTIGEINFLVAERVREYLKDAEVYVKLISFPVTLIGEVNRPGMFENYNNSLSIFEALGYAGDLTIYGNRKDVVLIRKNGDRLETKRLDLTDINLLASDYFYLMPNDVLYVPPMKNKAFRINAPNISIFLSSITTLIVVLNFINK